MPEEPPKDGEDEQGNSHTRLNPSGHEEFVVKKKRGQDEETLNELTDYFESIDEGYGPKWEAAVSLHRDIDQAIGPAPVLEITDSSNINYWSEVDSLNNWLGVAQDNGVISDSGATLMRRYFSGWYGKPYLNGKPAWQALTEGGIAFSNQPSMAPDQLDYQRSHNERPPVEGGPGEEGSPTNMAMSTPQASDGPERSRAKSGIKTSTFRSPRRRVVPNDNEDGLDLGATHSESHEGEDSQDKYITGNFEESFTGTAAIALPPGPYDTPPERDDEEDDEGDDEITEELSEILESLEHTMRLDPQKLVLNEDNGATFKSGGYKPGDYQMPSPTGDGVADKNPTQDSTGKYDTEMKGQGKEWPRDHNDTPAMCDVDDDGVEHKPQGSHESSVGEPKDGHQSEVGHNWPDEAKNSGSGVAEPFEGDRWSDGGTLTGGSGQNDSHYTPGGSSMPSDGPITGTSGPQLGQPKSEGWSMDDIEALVEGNDINVQSLFDAYARKTGVVCLEDFQQVCDAYETGVTLDLYSIKKLMAENREFMFLEGADAHGVYWQATPLAGNRGVMLEFQTRDPADEAYRYTDADEEYYGAHGEMGDAYEGDPDLNMDYQPPGKGDVGPYGSYEDFLDMGPEVDSDRGEMAGFGAEDPGFAASDDYMDWEDEMAGGDLTDEDDYMDEFAEMDGVRAGGLGGPADIGDGGEGELGMGMEDEMGIENDMGAMPEARVVTGPAMMEAVQNFLHSAKSIIETGRSQSNGSSIAEALNYSWDFHAGNVNANRAPSKVKKSLKSLMRSYPGFSPHTISENEAMNSPEGTVIGGGGTADNSSHWLAEKDQRGPDDMSTEKDHSASGLLDREPVNDYKSTPTVDGTEKKAPGAVKENVRRLSQHVKKSLKEAASSLRGKYAMKFSVAVMEGQKKNKTQSRDQLSEALADAEEILQFHNPEDVTLETSFQDAKGAVVLKHDVPMITIKPRGPIVSEGRAIFRFGRNAEAFANNLVMEGAPCKIYDHNWGKAVKSPVGYGLAKRAFRAIKEESECDEECSCGKPNGKCTCGWSDRDQVVEGKKKWMQDVKSTGECTPISKPSCTGRKKAFAKRVQKGGDLYQGKGKSKK